MQVGLITLYKQDDTVSFRGTKWLFSVFFFQHGKLRFCVRKSLTLNSLNCFRK